MNKLLKNNFKEKIKNNELQIGLWVTSTTPFLAEVTATAAYDWLLLDGEHAPNTMQNFYGQLQAIQPYNSHPIIRPVEGSRANIKQILDIGAQTILIPMVESAEQAREMYLSMCYPPKGYRGVGASVARASRWNRIPDYMNGIEENLCLLVQVENVEGFKHLDEIAQVEGVDGVFFGPADLSTDMGYAGDASIPEVQKALEKGIKRVRELGKAAGTLAVDTAMAKKCIDWGATFVAVGVDMLLYTKALDETLTLFKKTEK
jgi:2,4-dihydroxyhept-2-ene-1,7-dioic acid aldolase